MEFEPGQTVVVEATIVNIYHPDRDEAYQTLGLQLKGDGQALQTNVRNVRALEPEEEDGDEDEMMAAGEKAKRPVNNKAKRASHDKALFPHLSKAAAARSAPGKSRGDAEDD